jgi:SRSO17 transposase
LPEGWAQNKDRPKAAGVPDEVVFKTKWELAIDIIDQVRKKEELGIDHYEGRYWIGWHHHVTMDMLAQALLTLETLRHK